MIGTSEQPTATPMMAPGLCFAWGAVAALDCSVGASVALGRRVDVDAGEVIIEVIVDVVEDAIEVLIEVGVGVALWLVMLDDDIIGATSYMSD